MGGSLSAVAVIYGFAAGKSVPKWVGWSILTGTFVAAGYGAWKEPQKQLDALRDERRRGLRLRISDVVVQRKSTPPVWLAVDIENSPYGAPVVLNADCTVEARYPNGEREVLRGAWNSRGGNDLLHSPIPPGTRRSVGIDLNLPDESRDDDQWRTAHYRVTGTDSLSRELSAEYPASVGER